MAASWHDKNKFWIHLSQNDVEYLYNGVFGVAESISGVVFPFQSFNWDFWKFIKCMTKEDYLSRDVY